MDQFGLAALDGPGDAEIDAEVGAGRALEIDERPGASQTGADGSGSVWVTVEADGSVLDVSISRRWAERISADRLGGAVLDAYWEGRLKVLIAGPVGGDAGPVERVMPDIDDPRWLDAAWATLSRLTRELDEIRRPQPPAAERTVAGPGGHVRLRVVGDAVTEVLIDALGTAERSPDTVAVDLRDAFAEAEAEAEAEAAFAEAGRERRDGR